MSEYKHYVRTNIAEMRPYVVGGSFDFGKISVSKADLDAGSPKTGDMIARNPENHDDQWLVAKEYFQDNFKEVDQISENLNIGNGDIEFGEMIAGLKLGLCRSSKPVIG